MTAQVLDRKKKIADFIVLLNSITRDNKAWNKKTRVYKVLRTDNNYKDHKSSINSLCTGEKRLLGQGMTKEMAEKYEKPYKIATSTYVSYLTDYRNAILALNEKGFDTERDILKIQKRFKNDDLSLLNADMPELRNNLSELKKEYINKDQKLYEALHKLRIEPHAYYQMKPTSDVRGRMKIKSAKQLSAKHNNQKIVSLARIEQILKEMDESEHWVDLAIFIALASGRRAIEVLKTGTFKSGKKNHVLFEGQAKTKTREDNASFIIPTLIDTSRLINAHEKLKVKLNGICLYGKKFDNLDAEEINGGTAGRLNKQVKKLLGENFTFKDLRSIYAKRASTIYHDDKKTTSVEEFYSVILGHSKKDLSTQLSYRGIVISESKTKLEKIDFTTDQPKRNTAGQKTLKEIIKAFDEAADKEKGKAIDRIHEFVKATLQHDKDAIITQTFLGKSKAMGGCGASRPAIKKYLELIDLK